MNKNIYFKPAVNRQPGYRRETRRAVSLEMMEMMDGYGDDGRFYIKNGKKKTENYEGCKNI